MPMHVRWTRTRRELLRDSCCGMGYLAARALAGEEELRAAPHLDPLAPKPPHRPDAKAKAVIFLFYGRRPEPYRDVRPEAPA